MTDRRDVATLSRSELIDRLLQFRHGTQDGTAKEASRAAFSEQSTTLLAEMLSAAIDKLETENRDWARTAVARHRRLLQPTAARQDENR